MQLLDTDLSNPILNDHGVSFPVDPSDIIESHSNESANLPMLPDHFAANRIVDDVLDIGATIDPNPNRELATRDLRRRMIMDATGRAPHIANVLFYGELNSDGEIVVRSSILLPGHDIRQEVSPLIIVGIQYLIDMGGGKYRSNGTFQCLIFKPLKKKGQVEGKGSLKALPLGVGDPSSVKIWNRVAREMKGKNWPEIKWIPNTLRRYGVCTHTFLPTHDPNFVRPKGSRKRLLVGKLFGEELWLSPKSQLPEPDVVDGVKCFVKNQIFCIKLSEKILVLTWLGPEGSVHIDNRQAVLDADDNMDPYAALGTSTKTVDVYTIEETARGYLKRQFDDRNPLYREALRLKRLNESDPHHIKTLALKALMINAVDHIKAHMHDAVDLTINSLRISPLRKPTAQDVYQGKSRKVVLKRLNTPSDAAADWIAAALDCEFIPNSSFHMILRHWFICTIPEMPELKMPASVVAVNNVPLLAQDPGNVHTVTEHMPPLREKSSPSILVRATPAIFRVPDANGVLAPEQEIHVDEEQGFFPSPVATKIDYRVQEGAPGFLSAQQMTANERDDNIDYDHYGPYDPKGITGPIDPRDPLPESWEIGWFLNGDGRTNNKPRKP